MVLCSVGARSCDQISDHHPREWGSPSFLLKVISPQTEDNALKSSTLKSCWLNEFPQQLYAFIMEILALLRL